MFGRQFKRSGEAPVADASAQPLDPAWVEEFRDYLTQPAVSFVPLGTQRELGWLSSIDTVSIEEDDQTTTS